MTVLTVRDLSDEVLRALRLRAAENNRSREAELRAIIEAAVLPPARLRMGTALRRIGEMAGGLNVRLPRESARPVDREPKFDYSGYDGGGGTAAGEAE